MSNDHIGLAPLQQSSVKHRLRRMLYRYAPDRILKPLAWHDYRRAERVFELAQKTAGDLNEDWTEELQEASINRDLAADEVDRISTRMLVTRARKLQVKLPKTPPLGDHNRFWQTSLDGSSLRLTNLGESRLKRAIARESRNRWTAIISAVSALAALASAIAAIISSWHAAKPPSR